MDCSDAPTTDVSGVSERNLVSGSAGQISGRNVVRGPGIEDVDLSLFQYFDIDETWRVQVRFNRVRSMFARVRVSNLRVLFVTGLVAATSFKAASAGPESQSPKTSPARKARLVENYGKLPLSFEANTGQADNSVKFLAHGSGYGLYLTGDGAVLDLQRGDCAGLPSRRPALGRSVADCKQDVVRMRLAGASGAAAPVGEQQLPGKANYFIGNDPAKWHTNVPTYAKVRYHGVYPGVDLVYYGNQRQLEYDFSVAPGADPKPVHLQFDGAKGLRLGANGDLLVSTADGPLTFHKPAMYQLVDGHRKDIQGSFALLAKRTVGFHVGNYDRAKPLVIDPVLAYSTYLGASGLSTQPGFGDSATGLAVDGSGSAYIAGYTFSSHFPTTGGALQAADPACSGCEAAFVTKLNPSGTALLYSTYLVGSGGGSAAYAVAVDGSGNAYVTGIATGGFPLTAGAFQATDRAGYYATPFVAKLNPSGDALVYSTYLGGTASSYEGADRATAMVVDGAGNAYVAGVSFSGDFPVTPGAFQSQNKAGFASNAFVSKLNPTGSALIYSTYLGGSGRILFSMGPQQYQGDGAAGLAVDSDGNAYVTGYAYSADFPVTKGAFQTTNLALVPYGPGGLAPHYNQANAFVTKLNPSGTALIYSTYLGGTGRNENGDRAAALQVDGVGNAYVVGSAGSADFPVTRGAFQTTNHSSTYSNAFVTELNAAGSALVYSTYLGGSGTSVVGDSANGLALDAAGDVYVVGTAWSTDFPVTVGALQAADQSASGSNAFISELNPAGSALTYSTYLGGSGSDSATAVVIDGASGVYFAGMASSTDFPVTAGAFQMQNHSTNSGPNAFVAKLNMSANQSAPTITPGGIVPVDSTAGTIQPGEWVSIYGANLASAVATWTGNFAGSLGGTTVTIDGKAAYLQYVSPTQINLQAPDDTATGTVSVVVTTGGGSATASVTLAQFAPSFFLFDSKHVAGIILRSDGSGAYGSGSDSYDIIGPTGTSLGYSTVAAKAGDIVELFGTGFGPTNPVVEAGQAFFSAASTTNAVTLLIDNVSVVPMWAGLSSAGLDQINVTIPTALGTGNVPLVATVGGVQTPPYVVISLQ